MVSAMKAKEELRLSVLRSLLTLFMQELTRTKRTPQDTLSDDEVLALIRRALKQRKEASAQFTQGGRSDLAEKEDAEATILEAYLPALVSMDVIHEMVQKKALELGVTDKAGMGKLMGAVMTELSGKADGALVKEAVDAYFTK
jgi:uncharacterized protein